MSYITVNPLPDAFKAVGNGFYRLTRLATAKEIMQAAQSLMSQRLRCDIAFANQETIKDFFRVQLAPLEHEVFAVAFLNQRQRVFTFEILDRSGCCISGLKPADVARRALELNAAYVILAHTHSPERPEPCVVDDYLTTRYRDALRLFNISILDHLVISGSHVMSFSECGLL